MKHCNELMIGLYPGIHIGQYTYIYLYIYTHIHHIVKFICIAIYSKFSWFSYSYIHIDM